MATRNAHKRSLSEDYSPPPLNLASAPSTPTRSQRLKPTLTPKPLLTPKNLSTTLSSLPTPAITLKASSLRDKKLLSLTRSLGISPYPAFERPTADECQKVHDLLAMVHGVPSRPVVLTDPLDGRAGCGEVPSVLDALVRTVLSQNTTSKNSTSAKRGMDARYGRANYRAVLEGSVGELEETIRCGGLAKTKAKCIMGILQTLEEKEGGKGALSLDYLHGFEDAEAMRELVGFDGVGPKTASCVLLFCLKRSSFAVDTHVFRITASLGWLPSSPSPKLTRETAFAHLDVRIPDELKYGLHSLLVSHGRGCERCAANGVTSMDFLGSCPIEEVVKRVKSGKKGGKGSRKKEESGDEEVVGGVKSEEGEVKSEVGEKKVKREVGFEVVVEDRRRTSSPGKKVAIKKVDEDEGFFHGLPG